MQGRQMAWRGQNDGLQGGAQADNHPCSAMPATWCPSAQNLERLCIMHGNDRNRAMEQVPGRLKAIADPPHLGL